MKGIKSSIQILEYKDIYAEGLTKMWNESRDNWGGDLPNFTVAEVKKREKRIEKIVSYVAVVDKEVVGYVHGSCYLEEQDVLYFSYLNVRPDYLNLKIGKRLLLKLLEKSVELKKTRLVAHTWGGNIKAFPLYQSTGFVFKELEDGRIFIENFIPSLSNFEMFQQYFINKSYYECVKLNHPKGVEKKGTIYYEYYWESNENDYLHVQFENLGKGINHIETNNYMINLKLSSHSIIQSSQNSLEINIVNKTTKSLSIKVKSKANEELGIFLNEEEATVKDKLSLSGNFIVKSNGLHFLTFEILINGQLLEMKVGVNVIQPIKLTTTTPNNFLNFKGEKSCLQIGIENCIGQDVQVFIDIQDNKLLQLKENSFNLTLRPKQKRILDIGFTIRDFGYFKSYLNFTCYLKGSAIEYSKEIGFPIKGIGEKFGVETNEHWKIYNGIYMVDVKKENFEMAAGKEHEDKNTIIISKPKIIEGEKVDVLNHRPDNVFIVNDQNSITLQMQFTSKIFFGITVSLFISLYGEGLIKRWTIIEKRNSSYIYNDLSLVQDVNVKKKKVFFPLSNRVIEFNDHTLLQFGDLDTSELSGNWFFCENNNTKSGIVWPEICKAHPKDSLFEICYSVVGINESLTSKLDPIYISIGAFTHWEEIAAFAKKQGYVSEGITHKATQINLENQVLSKEKNDFSIEISTKKTNVPSGISTLYINDVDIFKTCESTKNQFHLTKDDLKYFNKPLTIVKSRRTKGVCLEETENIVLIPRGEVLTYFDDKFNLYTMNNGVIEIKTAPEFFPGIYSMKINGNQWIDSSFPKSEVKSWWNPWVGGMKFAPSKLKMNDLIKQKTNVKFVQKKDTLGNHWTGVVIETSLNEKVSWEGLIFEQYYLMLPGIPVIIIFGKIANHNEHLLLEEKWSLNLFLKKDVNINLKSAQQAKKYIAGKEELWLNYTDNDNITMEDFPERMFFLNSIQNQINQIYTNKYATQLFSFNQNNLNSLNYISKPNYLIFDERNINSDTLKNLRNIEFG